MKTDSANPETDRPQDGDGGVQNRSAENSASKKRNSTRSKRGRAAANKQLEKLVDLARQEFAEKKFADALRTCDLILALDPENFFALRYIARILTLDGDIDRAEVIWRRLCQSPRNKVEAAINVARFAERREQWETLAEFADLALREDPERLEALRMAILARVRIEQFADLFDLLPRLHSKEPTRALGFLQDLGNPEQLPGLAETFMRMAQATVKDNALTALRERSHKVWLVGARRAMAEGEDRLTGSYLRTVLVIEPSSQEAIDGLAILSRENLINLRRAIKKGDHLAAIYHAEITIEINPALVEAWFSLARLIEADDPDRAAEVFRTCVKLRPEETYYQICVGRSLRKAHKLDQALTAYEQARVLSRAVCNPRSAEIIVAIAELRLLVLRRGRELSGEGRVREAWTHFYAATGRSPLRAAMSLTAAVLRSSATALFPPATPARDGRAYGRKA